MPPRSRRRVEREASRWVARAALGPLSPEQAEALEAWLADDPAHADAHARLSGALAGAGPAEAVARAVDRRCKAQAESRRRTVRAAGGAIALAAVCALALPAVDPVGRLADERTGKGEVRRIALSDGSRLWLDAWSAADVEIGPTRREIRLLRGRIYVEAAHEPRPLSVAVLGGEALDVGTAFVVDRRRREALVAVTEGRVVVRSAGVPHRRLGARGADEDVLHRILGPGEAAQARGEEAKQLRPVGHKGLGEGDRFGDALGVVVRHAHDARGDGSS